MKNILKGLIFPISKKDLVIDIYRNSAPRGIMDILNGLQEKEYKNVKDILKEF